MIALCREHHDKADAGAFTVDQLRALKRPASAPVRGRFDWRRRDLLTVIGSVFYHNVPVPFAFRGEPAVWYNRDDDNHLLLNLRMVTDSGQPRMRLEDNDWLVIGAPIEFDSPPSGKKISARYDNGDSLSVEFFELDDRVALRRRFPSATDSICAHIPLPITAVEIRTSFGSTGLGFGPEEVRLPGLRLGGGLISGSRIGFNWA